jgi:hypothetical protein
MAPEIKSNIYPWKVELDQLAITTRGRETTDLGRDLRGDV